MFDIRTEDGTPVIAHLLSLTPFRRIVKDYFLVCDSYYAAIRTATPDRIEALDMGRRALHDEGSRTLDGTAQAQGRARFRYRAAAVHPDHGAALEGLRAAMPAAVKRPLAVLFACGLNSVRSPMAAALFAQIVRPRDLCRLGRRAQRRTRPFRGRRDGGDRPRYLAAPADHLRGAGRLEGLNFDLIVTLAPEAHHRALELTRTLAVDVEYWPTAEPDRSSKAAASSGSMPIARCATSSSAHP